MQKIIFTDPITNIVAVITPSPGGDVNDIALKDVPEGLDYEIVDEGVIPVDRTFRGAWRKDIASVIVDMPEARLIHMSKIRISRDKKLTDLDTEYLIADETNDGQLKVQIAQQKQSLRDLPETFDLSSANNPEELKALWPTELT